MGPALPAPKTKFATLEALPLVDAMQMCCPDLM
jgi:hypothetical protein